MPYMSYLPWFYRDVKEVEALANTADNEVILFHKNVEILPDDAGISTCSESRLLEWEQILGIIPQERDTTQRRMMILATLRGTGKLNEEKIRTIVRTFSGGGCLVSFENSVIIVRVSPPSWGEIFLFPDVEKALKPLVPAHIGLKVIRYYNTWENRKNQYTSWGDVKDTCPDWAEFRNKVEEI